MYFGLILLLLATLVSLPLVEVPIAVRAEGYLRASAETHSLIAPSSGEVAWVRARDRRSVARGDTILLLNRPDLYVRLEAIRARRVSVEQECRDLERLIAWVEGNGPPERPVSPRYREESKSIVAELESIGGQLRSIRREAFRSAAVIARGLNAAAHSVAESAVAVT